MDIMIADGSGYELGYLTDILSFDLDTTESYDFEVQMDLEAFRSSGYTWQYRIYCPGTEFGGVISDMQILSASSKVILMGDTWRGMLRKKIIEPPATESYKAVSGEANAVIASLIGNSLDGLFAVSAENSGFTITSYQFSRYTTLEEGLCAMLLDVGAKLVISYDPDERRVLLAAKPSATHNDYTDDQIHLTVRDYRRGINHLICLGQGELADRERLDLYVDADGNISTTQYYNGLDERVAVYDYSSAESTAELKKGGIERLKELMDYQSATLDVENVTDMDVGDIVEAEETVTGLVVSEKVTGLTLTINHGVPTITYKLGDDNG